MRQFRKILDQSLHDQRGLETVEYAILAALIVTAIATVIVTLGNNVFTKFSYLRDQTQ